MRYIFGGFDLFWEVGKFESYFIVQLHSYHTKNLHFLKYMLNTSYMYMQFSLQVKLHYMQYLTVYTYIVYTCTNCARLWYILK